MLRPYETADGRWLQFNMIRDEESLTSLLAALDALELLTDLRFPDVETIFRGARQPFGDEIQRIVSANTAADWLRVFEAHGLPVNMVAIVEETAVDEQVRINAMAVEPPRDQFDTPWIINNPIQVTSVPKVEPRQAPALGEHGGEILAEFGYSASEIEAFISRGII